MRYLLPLVIMLLACTEHRASGCTVSASVSGPNGGEIVVETEPTAVLVHIRSAFGIGAGQLELTAGDWPPTMTVRLYLKGLEGIRVSSGDQRLEPSSRHDRSEDTDYFELSYDLARHNPSTPITIHWVDFYR